MSMLDTVIRGGEVLDGTGREAVRADVGLSGGRIVRIGRISASEARDSVDASGMVVAPGFIDLHSHADLSIHGAPAAETYLRQGVTLLQMGNCGFSPFPLHAAGGDPGAPPEALRRNVSLLSRSLPWDWNDQRGFAASVLARRPGIHFALQAGHHAIRLAVMGAEDRRATAGELEAMAALVKQAAADGATGLSFGLIYAPGTFADRRELDALATAAAESGLLVSCHIRNETDHVLDAVDEILDVARVSGARLQLSHLKAMARPNHGKVAQAVERIRAAREDGVDVTTDVYPYTASSTTLTSRLSTWAMDGGAEALLRRLGDPSARSRIVAELGRRMEYDVDPAGVIVAGLGDGPERWVIGKSLTEIGREWGVSPAAAAVEVIATHQGSVSIINHSMAEEDIASALRFEHCAVASDGSQLSAEGTGVTHPRSFGTFPRVLARYVREQNVLSLPEAIRRMTSLPASRLRLPDRGRIAEGAAADIVVFDPATIADRSTFADPWQLSTGVQHLFLEGTPAIRAGSLTPARPGRHLTPSADLSLTG